MGCVLQCVAFLPKRPRAIGYLFRVFITVMSRVPKIKLPAADGEAPAPETIRSGANPDFVKFFAVTADRVTSPDVLALID